jgi:hypothetical protein
LASKNKQKNAEFDISPEMLKRRREAVRQGWGDEGLGRAREALTRALEAHRHPEMFTDPKALVATGMAIVEEWLRVC